MKKPAGTLADPLDQSPIFRAFEQRFNAIQRIDRAAAGAVIRFRPFINHRKRQAEIRGHLLGAGLLENFAEKFVGLHG